MENNCEETKLLTDKRENGTCDIPVKGEEIKEGNELIQALFSKEGTREKIKNRQLH